MKADVLTKLNVKGPVREMVLLHHIKTHSAVVEHEGSYIVVSQGATEGGEWSHVTVVCDKEQTVKEETETWEHEEV